MHHLLCLVVALGTLWLARRLITPLSAALSAKLRRQLIGVSMTMDGQTLAERLLSAEGLDDEVKLGSNGDAKGFDHYDSTNCSVNLTEKTRRGTNICHALIAAHEVGHALVDSGMPRLLKLLADLAVLASLPALTNALAIAATLCALTGSPWGVSLLAAALVLQVFAASVVILIEHAATKHALRMLSEIFTIPHEVLTVLRRCGQAALMTHLSCLAWPAALSLAIALTYPGVHWALKVVPTLALIAYAVLMLDTLVSTLTCRLQGDGKAR